MDTESFAAAAMSDDAVADEGQAPVAPQDAAEGTETEGQAAAAPQTDDDSELQSVLERYRQQNPELADAMYRDLQRTLTPKFQQAAEARREAERLQQLTQGLDEYTLQNIRRLNELADTNPQEYARLLRLEAERAHGVPLASQVPPEMPEFASDVEQQLWQWRQEMDQWRRQVEEQRQAAQVQTAFDRSFADAAKKFGEIPPNERQQAESYCIQHGIPPQHAGMAWMNLYQDRIIQQKIAEGQAIGARKAGMAPSPSGMNGRTGNAPAEPEGTSFAEAVAVDERRAAGY